MKNDLVSEVMTALEGVECECEPSEVTCYRCAALDSARRAEKRIEDLERSVGALRVAAEKQRLTVKAQYLALCNATDVIERLQPLQADLDAARTTLAQCDALVNEWERDTRKALSGPAAEEREQ